jgi:hypothetical protein
MFFLNGELAPNGSRYPLVGGRDNETEKCFRLDSSILPGPPPSLPARIVGLRCFAQTFFTPIFTKMYIFKEPCRSTALR